MGLGVPQYEVQPVTLLDAVEITGSERATPIIRLGGPSTEDNESFAGVQFHFQIIPLLGDTNSGMLVDFLLCYDGATVDDVGGVGNGPAQVTFAAATIGSSGIYNHTLNYETKDIGFAVQVVLNRNGGNRTLITNVFARRWRGKEIIG